MWSRLLNLMLTLSDTATLCLTGFSPWSQGPCIHPGLSLNFSWGLWPAYTLSMTLPWPSHTQSLWQGGTSNLGIQLLCTCSVALFQTTPFPKWFLIKPCQKQWARHWASWLTPACLVGGITFRVKCYMVLAIYNSCELGAGAAGPVCCFPRLHGVRGGCYPFLAARVGLQECSISFFALYFFSPALPQFPFFLSTPSQVLEISLFPFLHQTVVFRVPWLQVLMRPCFTVGLSTLPLSLSPF